MTLDQIFSLPSELHCSAIVEIPSQSFVQLVNEFAICCLQGCIFFFKKKKKTQQVQHNQQPSQTKTMKSFTGI